jgi:hypothetical protein
MRTWTPVLALVALLCGSAMAAEKADEKPNMDIPIYPGGQATMEVNLTNYDLLPVLQAMLPMYAAKLGDAGSKISPEEIATALKDIKRVEFVQVEVMKNAAEAAIADFYTKNIPSGEPWNRVYWQKDAKAGTTALYVLNQGEKVYGFRVQTVVVEDKPVKRAMVLKTEGKVDFVKLLTLVGSVMMK